MLDSVYAVYINRYSLGALYYLLHQSIQAGSGEAILIYPQLYTLKVSKSDLNLFHEIGRVDYLRR